MTPHEIQELIDNSIEYVKVDIENKYGYEIAYLTRQIEDLTRKVNNLEDDLRSLERQIKN